MNDTTIVLGNEPRAYREALAAALACLRSELTVTAVEPDALDAAVARLRPDLVVCSDLSTRIETDVFAWVLLYPNGARMVITSVGGERETTGDLDLVGLLAVVDRTVALSVT